MKKILLALCFMLSSCLPQCTYVSNPNSNFFKPKSDSVPVILVTIDGVRWQDMFEGPSAINENLVTDSKYLLPNIQRYFVENGVVIGKHSEMRLANPYHISLPGYYEMLTGKVTSCNSNFCNDNTDPTIVSSTKDSAIFASWTSISKVVANEKAYFNGGGIFYRQDSKTITEAESFLAKEQPEFVWISLGDTDEFGHAGNYDKYLEALHQADALLGRLMETYGKKYAIVVTTDHGRNNDWRNHDGSFESGRVWALFAGKGIPKLGYIRLQEVVYSRQLHSTILNLLGKNKNNSLLKMPYTGNLD